MTDTDFKIDASCGVAMPVFPGIDTYPASLDPAFGSVEARQRWETANDKGAAAQRALLKAGTDWTNTHAVGDYVDRETWTLNRDLACRDLAATVTACTAGSVAALRAYRDAQRAGFATKGARARLRALWLEADTRAVEAWAIVDEAIVERETLQRWVVQPERSAQKGRGHWLHSSVHGISKSPTATYQRAAMAEVVHIAPRVPVAQAVAVDKATS